MNTKNTKRIVLLGAVAALSMGLALAQESGQRWQDTGADRTQAIDSDGAVDNVNRASRLLGMQVRNDRNQTLGRIEDVIFDLRRGRVAYAVLAVSDFDGEKLIAVPPTAFSYAGPDRSRLTLHVDPGQLQRAPSLARGAWPDVERPFATFDWLAGGGDRVQTSRGERVGADRFDRNRRDQERGRFGDERRFEYREDYRTDRFRDDQGLAPGYQGATGTDRSDPSQFDRSTERDTFRGQIVAVNPEARTLSVEGENGQVRHFVFAERTNLQLKDNRNPRIVDLKVGFPVSVGFHQGPEGQLIATTVIRTDTPEVR